MKNMSRLALMVGLSLAPQVYAQVLEGQVVNAQGKAIADARVKLMGSGLHTITDKNGQFRFSRIKQGEWEVHVAASGFAHKNATAVVKQSGDTQLTLTLASSPIEVIDVTASPFHASVIESSTPASVLGQDRLRREQGATLGDTLEKEVGVHTNFHAGVASTPVIRGLSGPRVLITQNGLDVSDASRVGPDHSVASEASTAEQIEILRGPATLFYGSGAIGGVVNVVDKRIPTSSDTQGHWQLQHDSVNDRNMAALNLNTGSENLAFHLDGFWRESNDYHIPQAVEGSDKVKNSGEESQGYTLGSSYLLDKGYVGFSIGKLEREYGIPGHSHGDEEVDVFADLEQDRYQVLSELNFDSGFISALHSRLAYTDYTHAELELGNVGTRFDNQTYEGRFDILHHPFAGWRGGVSLHYKQSDFSAQGSEAFTPPSRMRAYAMALMEERHFGDWLVQLGGRVERVTLDADRVMLTEISAHSHDDDHDHDETHNHGHSDEHQQAQTREFATSHEFTPVSLSAGLVWNFQDGYNLGVSLSRSQRAPSASELLSFGPHIGTRTYEVGALFALHQDGDDSHIDLNENDIALETATNLDVSFRKFEGDLGIVINAFYNQVDDYYYQNATGLFAEDGHDHDHGDEHTDEHEHDHHEGELPVYVFQSADARLHGFEAQFIWQINDVFKANLHSDYVRARLKNGDDLPRTPPLRFGTELSYEGEQFSAHLNLTRYQKQDKTAEFETETGGYTLVDVHLGWDFALGEQDLSLYLKAENLTDQQAHVHTSFLKDLAPRPGRNLALGVLGYF